MRRLVLLVCALVFVDTMLFAALTPLLGHFEHELHLSSATAGLLVAAYAAGALIGGLPGGVAASRMGPRRAVLTGLALMAVASLGFAFSSSLASLGATRLLQGVGSAFTWAGAFSWLIAASPRDRRGTVIGTAMGAAVVGALFGPVVGAIAAETGRAAVFCGVSLLAGALAAVTLTIPSRAPERPSAAALRRAANNRYFLGGLGLLALASLLAGVLSVLAPLRLAHAGWGPSAIGAVWLLAAAVEAVESPLIGRLSDARGTRVPVLYGLAIGGLLSLVLMLGLAALPYATLIVAASAAFGAPFTPAFALIAEGADRSGLAQGMAFGMMNAAWALGAMAGPAGAGALDGATGEQFPFLLAAVACLGTVALLLRRPPRAAGTVAERRLSPGGPAGTAVSTSSRPGDPGACVHRGAGSRRRRILCPRPRTRAGPVPTPASYPVAANADPALLPADDRLEVVADAAARAGETLKLASRHLDPSLVDVLAILGFDREYVTARGCYVYDTEGRAYLDFHTGEGFASLGHNHPDVLEVLQATLAAGLADGVQIHYSPLAGMLAEALSERLPAGLDALFFTSTGAEAVDSALKFARAATRRPRLLSCDSGFHGVTMGPLSLVGDEFFKEGFGPLIPGCSRVPFGDLDSLEQELRGRDVAAFLLEPVQGRMVTLPPEGYLQGAQELCRRYGTLLVIDEIQTGLGRTGRWFALEHWGLEPDFVLIGKALSGGFMPVAAMATTREIYQRAVGTLERSYVHQSTFGRNRLSMAAGLATMRVIERDGLVAHAARIGALLADGLAELQRRHEIVHDVRTSGLMAGIELGAPSGRAARLNWRLIHLASEGLFPQLVVIPLHRDHGVITMAAGKNDVIKLLPPLTINEAEVNAFLAALDAVLDDCQGSAGRNWAAVRDIATTTLRRRASKTGR